MAQRWGEFNEVIVQTWFARCAACWPGNQQIQRLRSSTSLTSSIALNSNSSRFIKMRIVPQDAIPPLLEVPATLDANAVALHSLHVGSSQVPQRIVLDVPSGPSFFMPACYYDDGNSPNTDSNIAASAGTGTITTNNNASSSDILGMKIVSVRPGNNNLGLPPVTGTLIVMNSQTGAIDGLVDAEEATAWRTAAGSTLSALVIFQDKPPPSSIVIFGCGPQGHAHLNFLLHVFGKSIGEVTIISRSKDKLEATVSHFSHEHPTTLFHGVLPNDAKVNAALKTADIIATCTSASSPLFDGSLPKPGAHIICVGSYRPTVREIDETLVQRAWMIACDSRTACLKEAGEVQTVKGSADEETRVVNLGSLYEPDPSGGKHITVNKEAVKIAREKAPSSRDVSIYKSVGVAIQDVFMGSMLLRLATEKNIGTVV